METYRLKNIAIVILLLLNAFLLVLLGYQSHQARREERETSEQLEELYAASQLTLSDGIDLTQSALSPLTLSRRDETEAEIAAELLGGSVEESRQGGGIVSYAGPAGAVQFRAGGSFDGSGLDRTVDDVLSFAESFCREFGYDDVAVTVQNGTGTVTAGQRMAGVPIAGCGLTLRFENNVLVSASGTHVSLEDAIAEGAEQMSCVTALVRFLDYRETSGVVCSAVTGASCIYRLQGGAVSLRLVPAWRVETDTYAYYVDCTSGEVTRE